MDLDSFQQVLDQKLAASAADTRQHFDASVAEMRRHVDDSAAESRRHFGILAEELRSELGVLAESVDGLSSRVDRLDRELRAEMAEGFKEVKSMIRLSYSELDHRLTSLEDSVKLLQKRVEKLEKAA